MTLGLAAPVRDRRDVALEIAERALIQLVYEVTHLSGLHDDGSHLCRISREALGDARKAIADIATLREGER